MSINTVSTFLAAGTVLIGAGIVAVATTALLARWVPSAARLLESVRAGFAGYGLWLAWLMAVVATMGSLYFSQVAHFLPCEYCWYQRIAMYPLVVVLGVAAFRRDEKVRQYAYPLAIIGGLVSAYHYLIQQLPDWAAGTCSTLTPCTAALIWKFEFVSIPLMALVSFAAIVTTLLLDRTGTATTTDQDASLRPEGAA